MWDKWIINVPVTFLFNFQCKFIANIYKWYEFLFKYNALTVQWIKNDVTDFD